jgi:hypothetical protein
MANFSRNTFDPSRNYVAVRIEQGVPLVDADWNELADVARQEVYDGLRVVAGTAAARGTLNLAGGNNDLTLSLGAAIVNGRPIALYAPIQYTTQRYRNAATAAADGVAPVPDLTTPVGARIDYVYLDLFEREVGSAEDANLVNPAIGIQTSVRTRREAVLRVLEGYLNVAPSPGAGHQFLPIALLNRAAGDPAIAASMIVDIKPYGELQGPRDISLPPFFRQYSIIGSSIPVFSWLLERTLAGDAFYASQPPLGAVAGVLPLVLPDRSRFVSVRVRGSIGGPGSLTLSLVRTQQTNGTGTILRSTTIAPTVGFERTVVVPQDAQLINGSLHHYALHAITSGPAQARINGITVRYER